MTTSYQPEPGARPVPLELPRLTPLAPVIPSRWGSCSAGPQERGRRPAGAAFFEREFRRTAISIDRAAATAARLGQLRPGIISAARDGRSLPGRPERAAARSRVLEEACRDAESRSWESYPTAVRAWRSTVGALHHASGIWRAATPGSRPPLPGGRPRFVRCRPTTGRGAGASRYPRGRPRVKGIRRRPAAPGVTDVTAKYRPGPRVIHDGSADTVPRSSTATLPRQPLRRGVMFQFATVVRVPESTMLEAMDHPSRGTAITNNGRAESAPRCGAHRPAEFGTVPTTNSTGSRHRQHSRVPVPRARVKTAPPAVDGQLAALSIPQGRRECIAKKNPVSRQSACRLTFPPLSLAATT